MHGYTYANIYFLWVDCLSQKSTLYSHKPFTTENNLGFLLHFKLGATLLNKQTQQDKDKVGGIPSRVCLGGFACEAPP